MKHEVTFKLRKENFNDLVNKIKDLTTIDDNLKIKIDRDNILLYSTLGKSIMLAFKNYLLNTNDYLSLKKDLKYIYNIVISNSSKLVKNLEFLKDCDEITMKLNCREARDDDSSMNARSLVLIGNKLKINWPAGELYEVKDINKNILKQKLDLNKKNWSFKLTNSQFSDIKKLSKINSDQIINVNVDNGKVVISESSAWELEIGNIEKESASFVFNKKFFKCINDDKDYIEFSLFDSFILIKDDNSNLMLSYEQDFSDDEVY